MNCPICSQSIKAPLRVMRTHFSRKHPTLSESEKVALLLPMVFTTWDQVVTRYSLGVSEWELTKEFGVSLTRALEEQGIRRSHSETKRLPNYMEKISRTVSEKYGVTNISQSETIKTKKRKTCQERYGVNHYWQTTAIREKAARNTDLAFAVHRRKEGVERKYGVSNVSQVPAIAAKSKATRQQYLDTLSLEQKKARTAKARAAIKWISKPQIRVNSIFYTAGLCFIVNCPLFGFNYDLVFKDEKVIIEVNGTYWHGDPRKYKASDLIYGKEARVIWEKDKRKLEIAETHGYRVLVIWEDDLSSLSDIAIIDLWSNYAAKNNKD